MWSKFTAWWDRQNWLRNLVGTVAGIATIAQAHAGLVLIVTGVIAYAGYFYSALAPYTAPAIAAFLAMGAMKVLLWKPPTNHSVSTAPNMPVLGYSTLAETPRGPQLPGRALSAKDQENLLSAISDLSDLCLRACDFARECKRIRHTIDHAIAPLMQGSTAMPFHANAEAITNSLREVSTTAIGFYRTLWGEGDGGIFGTYRTLDRELRFVVRDCNPGNWKYLAPLQGEISEVYRSVETLNDAMAENPPNAKVISGIVYMSNRILQPFENAAQMFENEAREMQERIEMLRNSIKK